MSVAAVNGSAAGHRAAILSRPTKPARMPILEQSIPDQLAVLDRWLGWDWRWGRDKWDKPPVNVRGGDGSSTDPATWTDLPTALAAAEAEEIDGIGIALGEVVDGLVLSGIDVDDCRDPETGELSDDARVIIAKCPGYWEASPSGTGIKGLFWGVKPPGGCSRGNFEIYSAGRYFTVTGHVLPGGESRITDGDNALAWFHATYIATHPTASQSNGAANPARDLDLARSALAALRPSRADDYGDWLAVGMALHSVDDSLLTDWDAWSRQSPKFSDGECSRKWATFQRAGISLGSLIHWAREDGWTMPETRGPGGSPGLTDLGNAERFAAQHGGQVRYVAAWRKWLVWNGSRWQPDETGEVMRLAKRTARSIYTEAAQADDADRQRKIAGWAHQSQSAARLDAMLKLAASEQPLPVTVDSLDADPWLLNCENGTVDLRTGELRPHERGDLLTKTTGVEFPVAAAEPVLWKQFLEQIFDGDAELIAFVQHFCGLALIGETLEHILAILHGQGANGKTVLVETLLAALGDYGATAAPGLLIRSNGDRHPTELASLFGRRLVIVSESDEDARLNEALVKRISGGDSISARRMREDFWTFKPSHTAVMVTNHRPDVRGSDHAIWRRLRLVPFDVTIPEGQQDKRLASRLQEEAGAILRWMVDGCLAYQREGLQEPRKVMAATREYQDESDAFAQWFDERVQIEPGARVRARVFWDSFSAWCDRSGLERSSRKSFGLRITRERGILRDRSDGIWYVGAKLRLNTGDF